MFCLLLFTGVLILNPPVVCSTLKNSQIFENISSTPPKFLRILKILVAREARKKKIGPFWLFPRRKYYKTDQNLVTIRRAKRARKKLDLFGSFQGENAIKMIKIEI